MIFLVFLCLLSSTLVSTSRIILCNSVQCIAREWGNGICIIFLTSDLVLLSVLFAGNSRFSSTALSDVFRPVRGICDLATVVGRPSPLCCVVGHHRTRPPSAVPTFSLTLTVPVPHFGWQIYQLIWPGHAADSAHTGSVWNIKAWLPKVGWRLWTCARRSRRHAVGRGVITHSTPPLDPGCALASPSSALHLLSRCILLYLVQWQTTASKYHSLKIID